ncbi:MAG: TIGR02265 family protein [Myxococcota bacterium]
MADVKIEAELAAFRAETAQRLEKLTRGETIKGLYLRGYLEAYRTEGGEALYEKCRAELPEKELVDFFSYPYEVVLKMGLHGAEALVPKFGTVREFLRAMGRIAVNQYLQSPLGRTFLELAKPSPRAMLRMLPTAIATTIRFGDRKATFANDNQCTFACRGDFSPAEANAGAIEAVILAAKGRSPQVLVRQHSMLDYDLEATWS